MENENYREHKRLKLENTFVINQKHVCRLFNLSEGGISFGCTSERDVPKYVTVDIIDNYGLQLFDLPVETIWSAKNNDVKTVSMYEMVVGAKFNNTLSSVQRNDLDKLIRFLKDESS